MAPLLAQLVGHVQQHQRGNAQRNDARRKDQMAVQVGGVQNQNDRVGARRARHCTGQDVDGDFFILRLWGETIDARQVDERNLFALGVAHITGMVFDGDTGKIPDFLPQLGESIKESCLAGVGRADNGYRAIGSA